MNFLRSPNLPRLCDSNGARHYRFQIPGEFAPCNPSLISDGDGFLALVRTVNYRIGDDGFYRVNPNVTSINWLLRLDRAFRVLDATAVDDSDARARGPAARHRRGRTQRPRSRRSVRAMSVPRTITATNTAGANDQS
jgi:hypothetical protein